MASPKNATPKGSIAKLVDPKRLMPKMTPEDAAMLKLLKKRYGKSVYKG